MEIPMGQQRPVTAPDYDTDFFAWTQHQAKLLRALDHVRSKLPEGLDIDHVAEEIEDLGKAELRSVTSRIRQILIHLIKAASDEKAQALAHWRTEATTFQTDLPDLYAPSMRQIIAMEAHWRKAVRLAEVALKEHGGSLAKHLPQTCPYSLDDLLDEDFDFDRALERLRTGNA
jgi:hypothetical protein